MQDVGQVKTAIVWINNTVHDNHDNKYRSLAAIRYILL